MRAFKTVNDQYIEPISFTVPRRAETFQSDIYPPAVGSKPALSAEEWLAGKEALPPKIEFESIYEGGAPKEVPGDYKPAAAPAPAPAPVPKPAPKEPEPAPAARSPPPSMKDQGQSMAAMASKFEDKEEVEDDASSFEEISKPVQRKVETKAQAPTTTASAPAPKPAAAPLKSPSFATSPAVASPTQPASSNAAGSGSQTTLDQIRELLESQSQQLVNLTGEVESLKKRVGSGTQDQSERIRQLELELETLRS